MKPWFAQYAKAIPWFPEHAGLIQPHFSLVWQLVLMRFPALPHNTWFWNLGGRFLAAEGLVLGGRGRRSCAAWRGWAFPAVCKPGKRHEGRSRGTAGTLHQLPVQVRQVTRKRASVSFLFFFFLRGEFYMHHSLRDVVSWNVQNVPFQRWNVLGNARTFHVSSRTHWSNSSGVCFTFWEVNLVTDLFRKTMWGLHHNLFFPPPPENFLLKKQPVHLQNVYGLEENLEYSVPEMINFTHPLLWVSQATMRNKQSSFYKSCKMMPRFWY